MTNKHITFDQSEVMRELEKLASKETDIKDVLKTASSLSSVGYDNDTVGSLLKLASTLRSMGKVEQANTLEEKIMLWKRAEELHLYKTHKETLEDLSEMAHSDGDVPVNDSEYGKVETNHSQHKKIVDKIMKTPTGKIAQAQNANNSEVLNTLKGIVQSSKPLTFSWDDFTAAGAAARVAPMVGGGALGLAGGPAGAGAGAYLGSYLGDTAEDVGDWAQSFFTNKAYYVMLGGQTVFRLLPQSSDKKTVYKIELGKVYNAYKALMPITSNLMYASSIADIESKLNNFVSVANGKINTYKSSIISTIDSGNIKFLKSLGKGLLTVVLGNANVADSFVSMTAMLKDPSSPTFESKKAYAISTLKSSLDKYLTKYQSSKKSASVMLVIKRLEAVKSDKDLSSIDKSWKTIDSAVKYANSVKANIDELFKNKKVSVFNDFKKNSLARAYLASKNYKKKGYTAAPEGLLKIISALQASNSKKDLADLGFGVDDIKSKISKYVEHSKSVSALKKSSVNNVIEKTAQAAPEPNFRKSTEKPAPAPEPDTGAPSDPNKPISVTDLPVEGAPGTGTTAPRPKYSPAQVKARIDAWGKANPEEFNAVYHMQEALDHMAVQINRNADQLKIKPTQTDPMKNVGQRKFLKHPDGMWGPNTGRAVAAAASIMQTDLDGSGRRLMNGGSSTVAAAKANLKKINDWLSSKGLQPYTGVGKEKPGKGDQLLDKLAKGNINAEYDIAFVDGIVNLTEADLAGFEALGTWSRALTGKIDNYSVVEWEMMLKNLNNRVKYVSKNPNLKQYQDTVDSYQRKVARLMQAMSQGRRSFKQYYNKFIVPYINSYLQALDNQRAGKGLVDKQQFAQLLAMLEKAGKVSNPASYTFETDFVRMYPLTGKGLDSFLTSSGAMKPLGKPGAGGATGTGTTAPGKPGSGGGAGYGGGAGGIQLPPAPGGASAAPANFVFPLNHGTSGTNPLIRFLRWQEELPQLGMQSPFPSGTLKLSNLSGSANNLISLLVPEVLDPAYIKNNVHHVLKANNVHAGDRVMDMEDKPTSFVYILQNRSIHPGQYNRLVETYARRRAIKFLRDLQVIISQVYRTYPQYVANKGLPERLADDNQKYYSLWSGRINVAIGTLSRAQGTYGGNTLSGGI